MKERISMNRIKYIFGAILIFLVLIFIGEIYVWHVEDFETEFKYVTFYAQKNISQKEMLEDIYEAGKNNNVDVFLVEHKINNSFSSNISIYCTAGVEKYLENNSDIIKGKFESIFLGNIKVKIYSLSEVPDISKFTEYRMIGSNKDIIEFKKDLIDKYGGKFPQEGYSSIDSQLDISIIWGITFSLLLFMTLFDINKSKKEVVIRILSGERLITIIAKKIALDLTVFGMIFIIFVKTYQ